MFTCLLNHPKGANRGRRACNTSSNNSKQARTTPADEGQTEHSLCVSSSVHTANTAKQHACVAIGRQGGDHHQSGWSASTVLAHRTQTVTPTQVGIHCAASCFTFTLIVGISFSPSFMLDFIRHSNQPCVNQTDLCSWFLIIYSIRILHLIIKFYLSLH